MKKEEMKVQSRKEGRKEGRRKDERKEGLKEIRKEEKLTCLDLYAYGCLTFPLDHLLMFSS